MTSVANSSCSSFVEIFVVDLQTKTKVHNLAAISSVFDIDRYLVTIKSTNWNKTGTHVNLHSLPHLFICASVYCVNCLMFIQWKGMLVPLFHIKEQPHNQAALRKKLPCKGEIPLIEDLDPEESSSFRSSSLPLPAAFFLKFPHPPITKRNLLTSLHTLPWLSAHPWSAQRGTEQPLVQSWSKVSLMCLTALL